MVRGYRCLQLHPCFASSIRAAQVSCTFAGFSCIAQTVNSWLHACLGHMPSGVGTAQWIYFSTHS